MYSNCCHAFERTLSLVSAYSVLLMFFTLMLLLHVLAGQSMYSLTHSKPRHLQWTWLGHAEVTYGSSTLYVSTLQMYILLQFNQQQVEMDFHLFLQESLRFLIGSVMVPS